MRVFLLAWLENWKHFQFIISQTGLTIYLKYGKWVATFWRACKICKISLTMKIAHKHAILYAGLKAKNMIGRFYCILGEVSHVLLSVFISWARTNFGKLFGFCIQCWLFGLQIPTLFSAIICTKFAESLSFGAILEFLLRGQKSLV